jgi:endo-1,4-beta-D-glucanase Y
MKTFKAFIIVLFLLVQVSTLLYFLHDQLFAIFADSQPSVQTQNTTPTTQTISAQFVDAVPQGDIMDLEVYNASHQKVWQFFSDKGGSNISGTTSDLPDGQYTVSIGLFKPNWSSNYHWYDSIASFTIGQTPSPTPTPSVSTETASDSPLSANALSAYNDWKAHYVSQVNSGVARVVRPENNHDTVSEGIGYGMLFAVYANDRTTFDGLWSYAQKYLDANGLMNWNIDSSGNVIGKGAATDADEDMAYALVQADKIWPGSYSQSAHTLINAIAAHEISANNLPTPGDGWGTTQTVNPSYLAPHYYHTFSTYTGDGKWDAVLSATNSFLEKAANQTTGLVPDWLNADMSTPVMSFDAHTKGYYYDAIRTPIRLLQATKHDGNTTASSIQTKQARFVSSQMQKGLVSGYSLDGAPLTNYLDAGFLASYMAASQIDPSSQTAQDLVQKVATDSSHSYYGDSLKTFALFVASGK